MKKIYVANSEIAKGVESASKKIMSLCIDVVIMEFILLLYIMYWQIKIVFIDWNITIIAILLPLIIFILRMTVSIKSINKGSMANLIPYIVLENNKIIIINNMDPTTYLVMDNETDESIVEKIINNEIDGYSISIFENVAFVKETKKYYYFIGNLIDKYGKNKGEKKFKVMKIYNNYEELKMVK